MANESRNTDIETEVILCQERDQVAVAATSSVDRGKKGNATRKIEEMEGFVQHRFLEVQSYLAKDKPDLSVSSKKITEKTVTIYRVPEVMRLSGEKESLYKPKCINVYDPLWKGEDEHYYFHLYSILKNNKNKGLEDYLLMMEEHKEVIAKCNEEHISTDFSHLFHLLLCSCFILDLFLKYYHRQLPSADDPKCGHRLIFSLREDLLLVENQIPFFILEKVYEMAYTGTVRPPLKNLALFFFDQFDPMNNGIFKDGPNEVYHLLHLVHHSLIPSRPFRHTRLIRKNSKRPYHLSRMNTIPTATRLQQAGVMFRTREARRFVVEFNHGVLDLPHLHVGRPMKFLMNLIAWEQCHREVENYFTCYAIFLDDLVNTSKDMEILIESGVLEHSLKNIEEVVQVFNGLSDNLVYTKHESYEELCAELNRYSESPFNKWWGKLMIDYFGSPGTSITVFAAAFTILLTSLHSFLSFYSYFRPSQ